MTPRYPKGVSRSNSQMRRIRDVAGEDQIGVKRPFLQVDDPHFFQRMTKRGNEVPDEVMREWTWRLDSLLFKGDRPSPGLADPDRQVTVTVGFAQQQDRLVLRLLDANADDANFTHLCLPSAPAAVSMPDLGRRRGGRPSRRTQAVVRSLVLQRCRTSRTADLIHEVCNVIASAATSRARSSARRRAPAFAALPSGPAICAIRSDCRSAAERN